MNTRKQRNNLVSVIVDDLIRNNKISLVLMLCIIASASAILVVTQKTRTLLNEREQLLLEQDVLRNEWRNLILEENVLADQKRIEKHAISKLNMRYVTDKTESVVVIKDTPK